MKAYKGVLTSPTATGNQSITGLGFQPKVILFWATRNTAHGFSAANIQQMLGVAVSSTQRWVYVGASDNAAAASNAGRGGFTDQCIRMFSAGTPTLDAVADFVSHDADGFTINWSDAPSTAILVHYLALGGASLNVFAGSSATPSANGNASYTGVGFQPGFVLTAYNVANVGSNFTEHNLTLGFASASTAQGAAAIRDRDAQATMDVVNRQVTDKVLCASLSTSTSDVSHAALASFDTDGFTLTWSAGPISSEAFCYLCLGGESFKVGAETQNTSTGTKATTGVGFKPAALFAIGWNKAANTALNTSDMRLTIGAADGTREGHTWIQSADATADSDTDQRSSDTKILGFCTQPTTVNAEADLSTMDADGFTLDWTTADATARQFIYAALGPFESTGQTIAVGQTAETDTAQAVAKAKAKALGQPTETDTARAVAKAKTKALAQATSTETAQAITVRKTRAVGQAAETDTAQAISVNPQHRLVGQATETDAAQAIAAAKSRSIGQTAETDTAQAITWSPKHRLVGQTAETDAAQAVSSAKAKAVGQATSTETAQAITPRKTLAVGQASETDATQAVSRLKTNAVGQTTETDTAQAITPFTGGFVSEIGQAAETDSAQAITPLKVRQVGQAVEIDGLLPFVPIKTKGIGQAAETDEARAISWQMRRLVGMVTEYDEARPIPVPGRWGGPAGAAGAGSGRSPVGTAGSGGSRGEPATAGAGAGRGSSGSAGAGGARGTPGSAGSAGGRT